jgi:hypothetical protein
LDDAPIEDLGSHKCIVCPWHRFPISLSTGESWLRADAALNHQCTSKGVKQRVHRCRVVDGSVQVLLNLDKPELPSDHYATMGLYKVAAEQESSSSSSTPFVLHSSRDALTGTVKPIGASLTTASSSSSSTTTAATSSSTTTNANVLPKERKAVIVSRQGCVQQQQQKRCFFAFFCDEHLK